MFAFPKTAAPPPKCYFTYCHPPQYVDPKDPPSKKKPFSTILQHPFAHTAELVLPNEVYEIMKMQLEGEDAIVRYHRVNMSLQDILEPEFFNEYFQKGNVLMISEGRREIDNLYSIKEGKDSDAIPVLFDIKNLRVSGVLRLELNKATYERCGLVGKPIADGGRKHIKSRFEIEVNLRLPSMLRGKPGFDRLVRAAKEVLNCSISWLFYDISNDTIVPAPILKHHPIERQVHWETIPKQRVSCIDLFSTSVERLCEPANAADIYEWLSMISLDSPRLDRLDKIDSYLCRYEIPDCTNTEEDVENKPAAQSRLLMRVTIHGFLPTELLTRTWLMIRKAIDNDWAAMSVGCFGNQAYTVLEIGSKGTLVWEAEDRVD